MDAFGLTDPLGGSPRVPQTCPHCGSVSRVSHELCLHCLLNSGLEEDTQGGEESESLDNLLQAVDMRDADWRLGNYQILEEIGRGGMGVIYRARQRHSRRIVAVKRVLAYHSDSRETLSRFRREAEAAASLDHPNILPIYEVGESEGLPFFSMKFASGGSLLNAGHSLRRDPKRCIWLMVRVARAVHSAHLHGIVHRDLKPGNILLDARGEPLVSDFGLAKWLDTSGDLTRTLTIFGTPGYIAPEQAIGLAGKLGPAADIYSLGAILFDLLAGRPPFLGEHALAVIRESAENPAPKLRALRPSLDRDLETVCERCLEREPTARYQTANDLAADLERWLEGRPILARPVLPPTRFWRWCRRNRKLAAAATVCLMLCGVVIWLVQARLEIEKQISEAKKTPIKAVPEFVAPEKSIAVLPFENLSPKKEDSFFAEGIHADILDNLAKVADLKVIGRESVRQFRSHGPRNIQEIAKSLGVKYLLEGSVQRGGSHLKVSAQLIDATTGAHRWKEDYDRNLADVFDIQKEVARAIAQQLRVQLTPPEGADINFRPTRDLEAYNLFLKAESLDYESIFKTHPGENLFAAIRLLNEAITRDPKFFAAYCELSFPQARIYFTGIDHTPQRLKMAENVIKQAGTLRPNSGEVHRITGFYYYYGFRDYDRARLELTEAEKKLPNDPEVSALLGYIDRRQGRWDDSTRHLTRALDLDPRNFHLWAQLALTYQLQRRFAEMSQALDRALAISPEHHGARLMQSAIALERLADTRPLHDIAETMVTADPRAASEVAEYLFRIGLYERDTSMMTKAATFMTPEGMATDAISFPRAWAEALAWKMQGDVSAAHAAFLKARQQVEQSLAKQPDFPEAFCVLGMIDATLGRKENAIREGRRAVELLPLSKDAINGANAIIFLAKVYALTGEKDLALKQLSFAASIPSEVNYGYLLLDPAWDPLRGDPRFDKIVASMTPK